jgi:hypothetical protein
MTTLKHDTQRVVVLPPPPPPPSTTVDRPAPPVIPPPPMGPPDETTTRATPAPSRSPTTRWLIIGLLALGVIAAAGVSLFMYWQPDFVATSFDVPNAVVQGDDVVVVARLTNEGPASGDIELTVLVNDVPAQTAAVSVAAGSEEAIKFTLPGLPAGTHRLALADWEGMDGTVWVMTPARFEIQALTVTPSTMDINTSDQASVSVGISNVGEADGTDVLELLLNGSVMETRPVDLRGESRMDVPFTVTIDEPGTHTLQVGDATVTFDVHQIERPPNGTTLVNQIGGGANQLTIVNNGTTDAVVVLANPGDNQPALLSIYVHGGGSRTIGSLRDGTYVVYYAEGSDWCTHFNTFTQDTTYGRFDGVTIYESSASFHTIHTVRFGVDDGGGSPTVNVQPGDFPSM